MPVIEGETSGTLPLPRSGLADSGARQDSVRRHNLSLVLRQIVEGQTPPSRAEIAGATGLGKGTVSALVDVLLEARLVRELAPASSNRAGRPAVPLAPARATYAGLGLEVSSGYLGVRAVDLSGGLLAQTVLDTENRGGRPSVTFEALAHAAAQVSEVLAADGCVIAGACLAVPATVDVERGLLRSAPSLGWSDLDVLTQLRHVGIGRSYPLSVGNDANFAGAAELALARAGGLENSFVYVTGQWELGAAVILEGEVMRGQHGFAGEIGHVVVDPRGPACPCGRRGCLQQYVALEPIWRAAGRRDEPDREVLVSLLDAGDRPTLRAVRDAADLLARTLVPHLDVLDIDSVVLGDLLGILVPYMGPTIRDRLRRDVYQAQWRRPTVRAALAGDWAAMTGAARHALRPIMVDPDGWINEFTAVQE